jgi:tRNA(Ile)-lysidine synthase
MSRQQAERAPVPAAGVPARIPSTVVWPPTGQVIRLRCAGVEDEPAPAGRQAARFDADRFTPRLEVRAWRPGDAFQPQGMGGRRKKLQDYFSDIKLPRERRARAPLLAAPEGILWIVGHRTDHRFRVTPSTTRVMVAEMLPAEPTGEGRD